MSQFRMTPERYRQVGEIFDAALGVPTLERAAYLERSCCGDASLRAEVEVLLRNHVEDDTFLTPEAGPSQPAVIGPYEALEPLGEGGMGTVYRARQSEPIQREVALKVIRAGMGSRSVIARFESERRTLALMDHPYIAQVLDAGTTSQGLPFFAMELVEGVPLTTYSANRKLGLRERIGVFLQVCEAVQYAHQKGIIHRDLKPSNVLVREIDGKPIPKVIDFGLAKALDTGIDPSEAATMTHAGTIVGTLQYMSPEQADLGRRDIDTRSDVYSLGVLFYELLCGQTPLDVLKHGSDSYLRLLERIREDDPALPSVRGEAPELRGDLDAIALKALERDRNRRYASPLELAADIRRWLDNEAVLARPATTLYRVSKYAQRHRFAVAFTALAAASLISLAVLQAVQIRRITRERDRADRVTALITGMFRVSNPSEAKGNDIRAREILDKAAKEIDTSLKNDPDLQTQMMQVMGDVFLNLGLFSRADTLLTSAVDRRSGMLGASHSATLESKFSLAQVRDSESRYAEAEALSREVLDARRKSLGAEDRLTLESQSQLGMILNDEGKYAEAEKVHRELVEVARRKFGAADMLARNGNAKLAIDYAYLGRIKEAQAAFRSEAEISAKVEGPDSARTLNAEGNYANSLSQDDNYVAAAEIHQKVLVGKRRILGPEHPLTLLTMGNLALCLMNIKREAEAEQLFREVVVMKRRVLGVENRSTVVSMANLADLLNVRGKYVEAEALLGEALPLMKKTLGAEHSDYLNSQVALEQSLTGQKKLAAAEALGREVLATYIRVLGPNHEHVANSAYQLGIIFAAEGKRDEAFEKLFWAVGHQLGEPNCKAIATTGELAMLHGDPRFQKLVAAAVAKKN